MKRQNDGPGRVPMAYRALSERQAVPGGGNHDEVLRRFTAEGQRLADMLDRATPPEVMAEAPAAPARGPMALEPEYMIDAQGFRRVAGRHFREILVLELICRRAYERHKARAEAGEFVSPFTWQQVQIAGDYRELVKWRSGAPMRTSSFEGGRSGGSGSGVFIDSYIDQGYQLEALVKRIGTGVAISAGQEGRIMGRRDILDRELLDGVVLSDMQLPEVLRRCGWSDGGRVKARAQAALRRILDRMLGLPGENKGA